MKPIFRAVCRLPRSLCVSAALATSLIVLAGACATETTVRVAGDGGGGGGGGGGDPLPDGGGPSTRDAGTAATTPKAECERYLECINQSRPGEGGTAVTLYGDASPCWKGSSADAQKCGDACRTARLVIANEKTKAPACGCASDSECPKSFCSSTGACASEEWGQALTECRAMQAKALKPASSGGAPCWALEASRCDGIKSLGLNDYGGSGTDSRGLTVSASELRRIYKCGLATGAGLSYADSSSDRPAHAPAACTSTVVYRVSCGTGTYDMTSVDLLEFHER